MARSSSQPELHFHAKPFVTLSEGASTYPNGLTLHTTDTEYTVNESENFKSHRPHSPNLQTGSSITSLLTGLDTPV